MTQLNTSETNVNETPTSMKTGEKKLVEKKVNIHVPSPVRDALNRITKETKKSSVSDTFHTYLTDYLASYKADEASHIAEFQEASKNITNSKRDTIKVFLSDRDALKIISENNKTPMIIVTSLCTYHGSGDKDIAKNLGIEAYAPIEAKGRPENVRINTPQASAPKAAPKATVTQTPKAVQESKQVQEAKKTQDVKTSQTTTTPATQQKEEKRKEAADRGASHMEMADLPFYEIEKLASKGNQRAREIVSRHKAILKETEQQQRIEAREKAKSEGQAVVDIFRQEAEKFKRQESGVKSGGKVQTISDSKSKVVYKEVLVKDYDFNSESSELSQIRDRLDGISQSLDVIKPRGASNLSYQDINLLKRDLSSCLVQLNRYFSMRTRLYLREEGEMETKAS